MLSEQDKNYESLQAIIPDVSRETFVDFCAYQSLLMKWQRYINLTSMGDADTLWNRHFLDSAQLFVLKQVGGRWCDLGSGGGFPALVLAILFKHRGVGTIDLIESNAKKASFLRHVIATLSLPATIHHQRIENVLGTLNPDIITARALASLPQLLAWSWGALQAGTTALWMKGAGYQDEVSQAKKNWQFAMQVHNSLVGSQGVVLEITAA